MAEVMNALGQPIGEAVPGWKGRDVPPETAMQGRFCSVEPMDADRHARELFDAYTTDTNGGLWTYMAVGPFETFVRFSEWMETASKGKDPLFHAIIDQSTGKAVGMAAYMRIVPGHGVIEVGNIAYSPLMQRTPVATEAMYLMMRRVFDELGYRRYEWKCDALNAPSRSAALRLGFTYDGLFEQALIYKGRNRDTAWYSILDRDWPRLRQAFEIWLAPENFDADGQQKCRLPELIAKT